MSFIHTPSTPNSNSATINALASGGEQYQSVVLSDAMTPTNRAAVNSSGALSVQLAAGTNNFGTMSLATGANVIGSVNLAPNQGTAFASASRAAATYDVDVTNTGAGMNFFLDVTVVGLTGTVTLTIFAKDPASGKYVSILASAAVATTGTTQMMIHPGLTASANLVANSSLPPTVRVEVVVANAACAFSVGYASIP